MPKQDEYDYLPIGDALRKMADHHYGAVRRHISGDERNLLNEAADLLDESAPNHFPFTLQVAKVTPFPPDNLDFQVGERIRQIRHQKHLSLQDVEARSDAEFKASVLGAYERGERAISVSRLQRLALFYDVPVDYLWPDADDGTEASGDGAASQRKVFSGRQVGERIRLIRRRQGLSLQGVESLSGAEFKASVLGAYERGERAISVPRLQRLALFYDVPVDHLWPDADDDTRVAGDG